MFSGLLQAWNGMKPSHKLITALVLVMLGIGAIIIERALNDLVLDFLNVYTIMGIGILVTAGAVFLSYMKPHIIIVSMIGIGIIFILIGAYIGG